MGEDVWQIFEATLPREANEGMGLLDQRRGHSNRQRAVWCGVQDDTADPAFRLQPGGLLYDNRLANFIAAFAA
jgi:hypothetical protein